MALSDMRRVMVAENKAGDMRFFTPRFPIADRGGRYATGTGIGQYQVREELGGEGYELYEALSGLPIPWFRMSSELLEVRKNAAYSWKEIEPRILAAMREIYGDFAIDREPVLVRISYWFYRNFLAPTSKVSP